MAVSGGPTPGRSAMHERVAAVLSERRLCGRFRRLQPRPPADAVTDLANNDYLRLAQHPKVVAAAQAATAVWGASASASPLVSGYTEAHAALEAALLAWFGFPSGMLWNSGFAANAALLGSLPRRGDIVLADRLIHRSMISGILRSGARLIRYRHGDIDHLASLLTSNGVARAESVFVVTESVFSMHGDYPDLAAIALLRERHGFFWIVDEAHATGWYGATGSGLVEAMGVGGAVDALVGTLGKALGASGAFVLFRDAELRDYFINTADEFIYSTFFPPSSAAAALAAIELVQAFPDRDALRARARGFRQMLAASAAVAIDTRWDSAIVPVETGDEAATMAAADRLWADGYRVGAVRPPTVPVGASRLRVSLHAALDDDALKALADAVAGALLEPVER